MLYFIDDLNLPEVDKYNTQSAIALVRRCTRHRIPEPVRQADLGSRLWLREHA